MSRNRGLKLLYLVREPVSHGRETLSDIHITRELLRAVARGELSEHGFAQIETQHLESLCPVCRREIQAWRGGGGAQGGCENVLPALPPPPPRRPPPCSAGMRLIF